MLWSSFHFGEKYSYMPDGNAREKLLLVSPKGAAAAGILDCDPPDQTVNRRSVCMPSRCRAPLLPAMPLFSQLCLARVIRHAWAARRPLRCSVSSV